MEQVVYLDIIFAENFLINFLLVYIVARYCNLKAKMWRMSISALLGSCYVLIIFTGNSIVFSASIKILISFIMIFVAFGFESIKQYLKRVILFYITAFILSGAILAVFYMTNASFESINGSFVIRDIKYWHLIVGGLSANILVKIAFDYLDHHYRVSKEVIPIKLNLGDKSIRINALLDSGNSLTDPLTGKPIIVVYSKAIRYILPDKYVKLLDMETGSSASAATLECKNKISSKEADARLEKISCSSKEADAMIDKLAVSRKGTDAMLDKIAVSRKRAAAIFDKTTGSSKDLEALTGEGTGIDKEDSVKNTNYQVNYELVYQLNCTSHVDDGTYHQHLNFRMIPYKALGVENGKLLGFNIDSVEITVNDNPMIIKDPIIALYHDAVSENNYYEAIAYPEIIKGVD